MADDVASDGGNDLQTPYRKFIIIIEYRDVDLSDRGENNSDGGDVFDRCSDDEDDCYVGMEYPIVTSNEGHITVKITMQRDTDTQQSCNNLRWHSTDKKILNFILFFFITAKNIPNITQV